MSAECLLFPCCFLAGELYNRRSESQLLQLLGEHGVSIESLRVSERRSTLQVLQAGGEVLDKFAVHQKQFEVEKVTRLQREAQTLKRVGDEVFRIQQKITAERTAREAAIVLMKDDFMAAHKAREKADEVFKSEMLRKMAVVEKDLDTETKNREASEEQLVNALNDYTRALQDGLRIVNRASGAQPQAVN